MSMKRREIDSTLLGQSALDPFYGATSAARGAMFTTHIGQAPNLAGNEPRRLMTGVELDYAEHTFDIRFPVDATVLHVLRKYPTGMGGDSIRHNPLTTIIYEDYYCQFKTIGVIHVPEFNTMHQDFGYRYQRRDDIWERLNNKEQYFAKDDVIAASSAVKANGLYGMGLHMKAAFMSHPGTIEDGFVFSRQALQRMTTTTYSTYVASSGRKAILLNLYGDENNYKPFPDIGQRIRDDGVVMCMREISDDLAPADMTPRALRTIDYTFDRPFVGRPGSKVVDIDVYRDTRVNPSAVPTGMDRQMNKYYDARSAYYREVLAIDAAFRKRRGANYMKTPEFSQLIVDALIYLPTPDNQRKLSRMFRLEPLDEYRVEVTCESEMDPANGYKSTDFFGGKGVTCKIVDESQMPVDQNGNRAEVLIYGGSTIRRSNFGRLYEHYINACSRDLLHRLRAQCGLQATIKPTTYQLNAIRQQPDLVRNVWETLRRYYAIVAPLYNELLNPDEEDPSRHVLAVLQDEGYTTAGINMWLPVDNPVDLLDMVRTLKNSEFAALNGPVTYVNAIGQKVTTHNPVIIGDLYMMLLEKIGEDWSSVASVRTQQFGLPAKIGSSDNNRTAGREQAMRSAGESETRSFNSTIGPWATNELLDQTNNPAAHRCAVTAILEAPKPTDIPVAVDRNKVPYGGSRPVALANHLLSCRGIRFVYRGDDTKQYQQKIYY